MAKVPEIESKLETPLQKVLDSNRSLARKVSGLALLSLKALTEKIQERPKPALTISPSGKTEDGLRRYLSMSRVELANLYESNPVDPLRKKFPAGEARGRVLLLPGNPLNPWISKVASYFWSGKTFPENGDAPIMNRYLGKEGIPAEVKVAESWFDGHPSIILDYGTFRIGGPALPLAGGFRDEIREIAPSIYLGKSYLRTMRGPLFLMDFLLEFLD
jgi:hypothetical protein